MGIETTMKMIVKMNRLRKVSGFTLIELMIAVAIASTLMLMAVPSYQRWVQNSKIRSVAESVLHGLQAARAEAIRLNARVEFQLTAAATGSSDWSIVVPDTGTSEQAETVLLAAAADNDVNGVTGIRIGSRSTPDFSGSPSGDPPGTIVFTGLGSLSSATSVRQIDFEPIEQDGGRRLAIVLSSAGSVRLCDPSRSRGTSAQGC